MPYIKQESRPKWDSLIQQLIEEIKKESPESIDGTLNYIITRIFKAVYPARYYHYNKAIGVLECIKQEFYRRVVAIYENEKIAENGDV